MLFNIKHHIYAATRQRGGFGVFYSSKDLNYLNVETLDDIEKKCNYIAPSTFRDKDINNYPVNYAYYVVDDNGKKKAALLRSKYTGATNHTPDRAGNFLSHTIVFEDSLDRICLPPLFMSAPFLDHLTIDDESSFTPPVESFGFDQRLTTSCLATLLQFLSEDRRRTCTLLQIIDTILDGWLQKKGNNITVLAPSGKEAADLIFSLYAIIPAYLINKLSFATYTYNPDRVNYKICGVIPGCITEGFPGYIKVFEIEKQSVDYRPKYYFSTMLFSWIVNQDVDKITGLEKLFNEFNIEDFDKQVEIPFQIEHFINVLQNKGITDLNKILELFTPTQSKLKSDLIELVKTNNPKLYLEYLKQEMQLAAMRKEPLASYISRFESYLRVIVGMVDEKQVYDFYKSFEENARSSSYDIVKIAAILLTGYNDTIQICLSNRFLKEHLFKIIEEGWDCVASKDAIIMQYKDYLLKGNYPNINTWMKKKQIETDLNTGLFFNNINTYENQLKKMPLDVRTELFIKAIIVENNKGKMSYSTLDFITSLISSYFKRPELFWHEFFKRYHDVNNGSEEAIYNDVWPIPLIKRNVLLLEARYVRFSGYQALVESLDEYDIQWLSDAMIMLHAKKSHENFINTLPPKKKKGLWGLINNIRR